MSVAERWALSSLGGPKTMWFVGFISPKERAAIRARVTKSENGVEAVMGSRVMVSGGFVVAEEMAILRVVVVMAVVTDWDV